MKTTVSWNTKLFRRVILRHIALIIIVPVILAAITILASQYFGGIKYIATSELVQKDNQVGQISAYQNFIQTNKFKDSMRSQIRNSQWNGTKYANEYSVIITTTTNSPFFNIVGSSDNPYFSRYITNTATSVFQKQIAEYITNANISLLTAASLNTVPIKVSYTKSSIIAIGVGLVISLSLAFIKEIRLGKIDDNYLEDVHGLKKLGTLKISENR